MTKQLKADLSLILVTVVWGASFPVMSVALKSVPPYSFIAIRYTLAAIILALIFFKKLKNFNKKVIKAGVLVGLALGAGSMLQAVGLIYTTSSKSGFITGLNVILVPVFLAILYKKFPDFKTNLGVVFSLSGLSLMSLNRSLGLNRGDFLTLLSAVAFAVQIILVDKYSKDMDAAFLTIIELLTVGVMSFLPALTIEGFKMDLNVFAVSAILFTALFCTIFAYGLQNVAQAYTTPTHTAIIFLAEPVFSAIFSVFIGDKLTGRIFWGCFLIFAGMIVINLKINRGEKITA
ncbi:DMT family transporter [Clostridium sp. SYSU_GA19001]|uniref:DMT family transporter n=1 Tax=Clostridium caldaquaticum TaxID=2940653 RepID=UPI002076EBA9|nr:DMT family transporter [Clostridium caldaquaticum]MCM8712035.1 DMT family transporter [Clostridium caldaquaticum]